MQDPNEPGTIDWCDEEMGDIDELDFNELSDDEHLTCDLCGHIHEDEDHTYCEECGSPLRNES